MSRVLFLSRRLIEMEDRIFFNKTASSNKVETTQECLAEHFKDHNNLNLIDIFTTPIFF